MVAARTGCVAPSSAGAPAGHLTVASAAGRVFAHRNLAAAMQGVPDFIVKRQLEHFAKADPAYGEGVRRACEVIGAL